MGMKLFKVQKNDGATLTGEVFSGDIQRAELYQQEGFHHIPVVDADGILIPIGHGASHGVVVCPGRRDAISNDAGETIIYSVTSTGEVKAKVTLEQDGNVIVDAPGGTTIKLGTGATEPLLLGQIVLAAFTALFSAWLTALNISSPPPTDPNWAVYKSSMITAVTVIQNTLANWLSSKSLTE